MYFRHKWKSGPPTYHRSSDSTYDSIRSETKTVGASVKPLVGFKERMSGLNTSPLKPLPFPLPSNSLISYFAQLTLLLSRPVHIHTVPFTNTGHKNYIGLSAGISGTSFASTTTSMMSSASQPSSLGFASSLCSR